MGCVEERKGEAMRLITLIVTMLLAFPALSADWFYGHAVPTMTADAAIKNWHDCIVAAVAQLDDRISSVMDVAAAVAPFCGDKETEMTDAINKEFLDKNPGIASYTGVSQMEDIRREAKISHRQTIGGIILQSRKRAASQ